MKGRYRNVQADILLPDDPRWVAMLRSAPHDVYALPGYVVLSARLEGGRPAGVLVRDGHRQLLLPLILREIPGEPAGGRRLDATSPYGYPGVVLSVADPDSPATSAFLDGALEAAVAALHERGVISLFLRLHPLLPVDTAPLARHGTVVDHGRTVSVDLRPDEADLFPTLRRDHARNLRRLDRLGFTVEVDEAIRPESVDQFVEIYRQTMDRLGASDSYYVDARYVRELAAALDGRLAILLVRDGDVVAAAGTVTVMGDIAQSLISGTRNEYVRLAPSKLKVRESARWAKAQGSRVLHLGGGVGGAEDALFDFKAGFSPDRHDFQTARFVIDAIAYDDLVAQWTATAGQPASDVFGFFPPYRAPLPVASG